MTELQSPHSPDRFLINRGEAFAAGGSAGDRLFGPDKPPLQLFPPLSSLRTFRPDSDWLKRNRIVGFRGRSSISRPFNLLRTQITQACIEQNLTCIGISSAVPHEGKSFVCANLAAALSRLPNLEVYLLDLDLRRPSVAHSFGLDVEHGLEAFLHAGKPELEQIGWRIEGTNLAVFPSVAAGVDTAETLNSPQFETLMAGASAQESRTRIVLCDLPPVFVGDDAMTISRHLDAYIHVVGAGQSSTRQFEELRRLMGNTLCLGSILNRYAGGPFDPYGYGGYGGYGDKYGEYFSEPS